MSSRDQKLSIVALWISNLAGKFVPRSDFSILFVLSIRTPPLESTCKMAKVAIMNKIMMKIQRSLKTLPGIRLKNLPIETMKETYSLSILSLIVEFT